MVSTIVKRKRSNSHPFVTVKKRSSNYTLADRVAANPVVNIRNKKAVKVKKVKKVRVSKKLKAKIMKVIDKKMNFITGSYTDTFIGDQIGPIQRGQFVPMHALAGYRQVDDGSIPGGSAFGTPWHFTIPEFINAASCLFNRKPIPANSYEKYKCSINTGTLTEQNSNFGINSFICDVRDSYSWYTFKNGTQHAVNFALLVCVPKRKGSCTEWNTDRLYGTNDQGQDIENNEAIQGPYFHWVQSLNQDQIQGQLLLSYRPTPDTITGAPTLGSASVNDLFRMPTESKNFNTMYKTEVVRFYLQPGQEVKYKLQGPKNLHIDCTKEFRNGIFMNVQRYSRAVSGIIYNSPNSIVKVVDGKNQQGTSGRWTDTIDKQSAGFALFIERTDHISLKIPEQAGFVFPNATDVNQLAGKTQTLNLRRPRQINNIWAYGLNDDTGTKECVDLAVMNPQQPVAPN